MFKMTQMPLAILLLAAAMLMPTGCSGTSAPAITQDNFILHAGGATPDGIVGSNSLEALDYSYELGYRTLEMDFCWTEDSNLVCIHDWESYYAQSQGKESLTYNEFCELRQGTYGFTSMTLEYLAEWMREHPDAYIVTDIKTDNVKGASLIKERYADLCDRFIIQIYSTSEYDEITKLGFDKIILTVYAMTWKEKTDTEALCKFANENNLMALTFPVELMELSDDYLERLQAGTDTPLYVHTVNDGDEQKELFSMGIAGIYTDTGNAVPDN